MKFPTREEALSVAAKIEDILDRWIKGEASDEEIDYIQECLTIFRKFEERRGEVSPRPWPEAAEIETTPRSHS